MSSRHSHGSESSRGPSRPPSREPSRLSTFKIQPAPSVPAPEENGKLEENENEEPYQEKTEEQGYDNQEETKDTAEENSVKDSVRENSYREDTEDKHDQGEYGEQEVKEEKQESDKESEKQEDGYEAEDEEEDQPEVPSSPVPEVKEQSPGDFESQSFLNNLFELSEKLQTERYQTLNEDFPVDELKSMVTAVVRTMDNFKNYTIHAQKQIEGIREHMKDMREKIHKKIATRPCDPNTSK